MKFKTRLLMLFFPKVVLREAFHRGRINMDLENMMNYGILVHPKETKEKILQESSFDVWLQKVVFTKK
jgi:hypothetical protein